MLGNNPTLVLVIIKVGKSQKVIYPCPQRSFWN